MKKIMMGCLAAVAVLIALASCSQDYTTYSGPSHIMFSDTLYQYAVQETNEVSMFLFRLPRRLITTAPSAWRL